MSARLKTKLKSMNLYKVVSLSAIFALSITSIGFIAPQRAHAAQSPTIMQCEAYRPLLQIGVANQAGCVAAVQGYLQKTYGFPTTIDGIYGGGTALSVHAFQMFVAYPDNPGEWDGIVGNHTWNAIRWFCTATPHPDCRTSYFY